MSANLKPSYRGLIDAKIIKRTDNGMAVLFDHLRVRPGFNFRDTTVEDYETDMLALMDHIQRGGKIPALEVVLSDDGQGVDIVEGHRRREALRRLRDQGVPVEWVRIEPFTGNEVDQVQRVLTSQENRKLTPLEVAEGYRRLSTYNLTPDDIARRVGKTRQHVDQLLILANAPHAVQQMVKAGTVSATLAMQMVRTHGNAATRILQEQLAGGAATTSGGKPKKITAKLLKPWTPPAKVVAPVLVSLESFMESIPLDDRVLIEQADKQPEATVTVNAKELRDLFMQFGGVMDARKAADERAREKQAKAAQGELAVEGGA